MKFILLFSILLLCSCNSEKQTTGTQQITFNENDSVDINNIISYKFIPLETNDNCLVGNITNIKVINDHIYMVDQHNKLLVFDLSGKFVTQIGNSGNGPGEYKVISNFYIDMDKQIITIADGGQSRIVYYSLKDYKHLSTKKIFPFIDCEWLSDGNIAWYTSRGFESDNKALHYIKITNQDFEKCNVLFPIDFILQFPISINSPFYKLNTKCYFNLPHIPEIYEISSQSITPVYHLELDNHKFAPKEWIEGEGKDDYSSIVYTDYISAQNVKETDSYISISYFSKGANAFIGFYNKESGKSFRYSLPEFIRHTGLNGTNLIKNTYGDYFITTLNASTLKRNPNSRIPELKYISEKINEEDNPVICLFKLK